MCSYLSSLGFIFVFIKMLCQLVVHVVFPCYYRHYKLLMVKLLNNFRSEGSIERVSVLRFSMQAFIHKVIWVFYQRLSALNLDGYLIPNNEFTR